MFTGRRVWRYGVGLLILAGLAWAPWGCGGASKTTKIEPKVGKKVKTRSKQGSAGGLVFTLSGGVEEGAAGTGAKVVSGRVLTAGEREAIIKRLPAMEGAVQKKAFALRARSLPAPRTGKTVSGVFPPPQKPPVPDKAASGELKVRRASPQDAVGLAPNLSVTFSQPMVAVTSHADTLAKGVPVKLQPKVDGAWRWVGTKTLLFEPKPRFAMATEFSAEVPAGTTSATGGKLKVAHRWKFSTPAPRLQSYSPSGGSHRRDVLFYVRFDQRIDAKAVLATIKLEGDGRDFPLRMAGSEEISQDERVGGLVENVKKGQQDRWLAFRAKELLPADTRFKVKIGPGTPSAEGPLKTKKAQTFTFRTYAPLKVSWHNCKQKYKCRPMQSLRFTFNNRLEVDSVDKKAIKVSPVIPDRLVQVSGRGITIAGRTKGRTTYRVVLPASIKDVHGQQLGGVNIIPFHFDKAPPHLYGGRGAFRILDPSGKKELAIHSINHKTVNLELYRVKPADWPAFVRFHRNGLRKEVPMTPPGKLALKKTIQLKGAADELTTTAMDLRAGLSDGVGQVVVVVKQRPFPQKRWKRQYVTAWVQSSAITVDAVYDHERLLALVTRLADGAPVANAEVSLLGGASVKTNARGLAELPLPTTRSPVLVARHGKELAMLPRSSYSWGNSGWQKSSGPGERFAWYVFDDRGLYKPKETVQLKGFVRLVHMGKAGGVKALPAELRKLSYEVFGPRRNRVAKGTAEVSALGGFDLSFKLPDTVNLGRAWVQLQLPSSMSGYRRRHMFRIEEFRRPEFEVSASASGGPHLVGGHGQFTATASYFSGGPLPHADVNWHVTATPGHFSAPGHAGYTFVGWRPSWWRGSRSRGRSSGAGAGQRFKAQSDARGEHMLRVDFQKIDPPRPMVVRGAATIYDVNRRAWTAKTQLLVHPSRAYVGLKTKRYFVERGKPLEVEGVVVDIDGKILAGRAVEVQALRLQWGHKGGVWQREEVDPQTCRSQMSAKPFSCTFKTEKGGTYLLRATVQDEQGRKNVTEMTRWVSGGKMPPKRRVEKERVELIAHKKEYKPGEVAEVLVRAPFEGAEGVLTVQRGGILRHERFKVQGRSHTLEVKLGARDMPSLRIQVDLVGKAARVDDQGQKVQGAPPRPAFARGSLSLSVPARERTLKVEVAAAQAKANPGAQTSIGVHVVDAAGKPAVGAEVALVVVDEAVLALTGYSLSNPVPAFYPGRYGGVSNVDSRARVELADPLALARAAGAKQAKTEDKSAEKSVGGLRAKGSGYGRGGGGRPPPAPSAAAAPGKRKRLARRAPTDAPALAEGGEATPIAVRKDFRALALFAPRLQTDAAGKVSVPFKLPDNLTRYRVMAVAAYGAKHYGKGESNLTARLPLMIRPSPPRFLNFGDKAEIPVVLHNQTGGPLSVRVAMTARLVTLAEGTAGREISVPADDRVEVRFPVEARAVGKAEFQLGVVAGNFADAAKFSFSVWTPATTEAFATYGAIDKGAMVQPVKMPSGVVTQFGGIEITTSSTAVSALTDAVLYLVAYPYECSEQLSSRVLAVAALKDVLAAFEAPGLPPPKKILAAVTRDLRRLRQMQNSDGGFPFWVRGKRSWPYLTVHVAHALQRAKQKGFVVNAAMLSPLKRYLRAIESHIPSWYSEGTRRAIVAYSLYVRNLGGDRDLAKARSLFAELKRKKKPNLEAIGWIYPVLSRQAAAAGEVKEIRRLLNNRVTETAAGAHFVTSYSDGAHLILHSNRRVDGILLDGLIEDQPKSDLILKIVRGLLSHRKRGRWGNTQENAWVLLGLDRYFRRYEKATPNFVARAWLGERFAGQHAFRGRSTERHEIAIPMDYLAKKGGGDLTVAKQGRGRLYYRIGMRYAPADLKPPPADHGFTVTRSYEAVDKSEDVRREKDGTWHVKAGARVRVRLRMVAPTRRYHVALVDPLPAGLEPINSALRGVEDTPDAIKKPGISRRGGRIRGRFSRGRGRYSRPYWYWRRHWYEHQNLRDERAEAFSSLVWGGVHEYTYLTRATTPGTFVVPPPKAEEMYHPETFGRGAGDRLVVR